ncbi:MAG: cell division protein FtsB [Gallionellaceae bacterium]|nr:cell division protein FtsB [Gallionellaceae bacterium]
MRWVSLILVALILLLQYPLWLGKGGWLKVWDIDQQLEAQKKINQETQIRNAALDAEVRDLKQGTEAIEERARSELGMVKRNELFFQIVGDVPISAVSQAR